MAKYGQAKGVKLTGKALELEIKRQQIAAKQRRAGMNTKFASDAYNRAVGRLTTGGKRRRG